MKELVLLVLVLPMLATKETSTQLVRMQAKSTENDYYPFFL
jgi:hypothetical protein